MRAWKKKLLAQNAADAEHAAEHADKELNEEAAKTCRKGERKASLAVEAI